MIMLYRQHCYDSKNLYDFCNYCDTMNGIRKRYLLSYPYIQMIGCEWFLKSPNNYLEVFKSLTNNNID